VAACVYLTAFPMVILSELSRVSQGASSALLKAALHVLPRIHHACQHLGSGALAATTTARHAIHNHTALSTSTWFHLGSAQNWVTQRASQHIGLRIRKAITLVNACGLQLGRGVSGYQPQQYLCSVDHTSIALRDKAHHPNSQRTKTSTHLRPPCN
jgi:hypothetical protein